MKNITTIERIAMQKTNMEKTAMEKMQKMSPEYMGSTR